MSEEELEVDIRPVDLEEDEIDLSEEQVAELKRRIDDLEDKTRYLVISDGSFYNVNTNSWVANKEEATFCKRDFYAQHIIDFLGRGHIFTYECLEIHNNIQTDTEGYVLISDLLGEYYFDIDTECWGSDFGSATIFKSKELLEYILENSDLDSNHKDIKHVGEGYGTK